MSGHVSKHSSPSLITPRVLLLLAAVLLAPPHVLFAQAQDWVQPERSAANLAALARVQVKTHQLPRAPGVDIPYGVYVPTTYDRTKATPLVIALHGLGSDEMYMMEYNNLVELAEQHGFLVATPMGYDERGWYGSRGQGNEFNRRSQDPGPENLGELSELDVMSVLDIMRHDYNVDPRRTYLIGQSMGGGGTWYIGTKHPEIWAALGAMAPAIYTSPDVLENARALPVIVVQGDADQSVNPDVTRRWVAKMKDLGMEYQYIEVPGGTHASAGRLNIDKVFDFLERHSK
jgi:poly(3-hydroxybutyrate) depolymerase